MVSLIHTLLATLSLTEGFLSSRYSIQRTANSMSPNDISNQLLELQTHFNSLLLSVDEAVQSVTPEAIATAGSEAVSVYSKVDKTGFIGFIATYVEEAIDLGHNLMNTLGLQNNYGYSIILFTLFVKALTLPLTTTQLESTTKMQQLTPYQQKIQLAYAKDEQTKNQLLAQLFQAANVNPLAGCLPALVQIPIFISLYRALQNLVAENKLDEPFLWIPDLQGPVYTNPPGTSMDWIKSVFSGNPILGWHDTLAFLTLPLILWASQSLSQRILQPPRDPNKVLTEQEQVSQGIINNLPFIVAFFSINVPAGLAVYWIINNILTTLITVVVKKQFADQPPPIEVTQLMAAVDATLAGGPAIRSRTRTPSNSLNELRSVETPTKSPVAPKTGFSKESAIDASFTESNSNPAAQSDGTQEEDEEDEGESRRENAGASTSVDSSSFVSDKKKGKASKRARAEKRRR